MPGNSTALKAFWEERGGENRVDWLVLPLTDPETQTVERSVPTCWTMESHSIVQSSPSSLLFALESQRWGPASPCIERISCLPAETAGESDFPIFSSTNNTLPSPLLCFL